ncbi:MAG: hypothetical protein KME43_16265 [Myxacorys chilensis ATA2-1-KO14]|jgi:hypothetical protein|nr:hypothetical protein [Myxacorys chilensis ATA2-1-KO14]
MQTGYAVATVADLRAIPANRRVNGMAKTIVAKKKWYQYDSAIVIADDGDSAIVPDDGVGAWTVMHPPNADGGSSGGGDGGTALITVQNGKPTTIPTEIGQLVADVRSDRKNLWIAVGTSSASDWRICSGSPVTVIYSPGQFNPGAPTGPGDVPIDYRGQRLVFGAQDPYGVTLYDTVYVAVQYQAPYYNDPFDDTLYWAYDAGYQ